ncbi:MAG: hypothetical protein R3B48_24260 [Kofleriaceae bacterium]
MFPSIPSLGAVVYLASSPISSPKGLRSCLENLFASIGISPTDIQAALFRSPFTQGKWREQVWKAFDDAAGDEKVETLNLLVGSPRDVRFAATVQLRNDVAPQRHSTAPLYIGFACESQTWSAEKIGQAARSLLEHAASGLTTSLFGGVFRAPVVNQALHEIHSGGNLHEEPKPFYDRIAFDLRLENYWTKARRLYPVTLLGPKLASQLSAADALAAGALAVQEISGSLLIDAYPSIVETWDPEFLRATVSLRKWLWPHTIQNPADAAGLGIKLAKR